MQATRLAKGKGADEAVLVRPDGIVLEAPTSTIFWASGGTLCTLPRSRAGSSSRSRAIASCASSTSTEGEYTLDDLLGADEAFLASTVREVQPISSIDGTDLSAAPGPLTEKALVAFQAVLERELPQTTSARG